MSSDMKNKTFGFLPDFNKGFRATPRDVEARAPPIFSINVLRDMEFM